MTANTAAPMRIPGRRRLGACGANGAGRKESVAPAAVCVPAKATAWNSYDELVVRFVNVTVNVPAPVRLPAGRYVHARLPTGRNAKPTAARELLPNATSSPRRTADVGAVTEAPSVRT